MFLLRWGKTKSIPTFKTKIGDLKKNVFIPACTKANGAYKHHHFSHEVSKFRSKIFWLKIFSKKRNPPIFFSKNFLVWKKILGHKIFLVPKKCLSEKIYGPKKFWFRKFLGLERNFWSKKCFVSRKKKMLSGKNFELKIFGSKKIKSGPNNFCKKFWSEKFLVRK